MIETRSSGNPKMKEDFLNLSKKTTRLKSKVNLTIPLENKQKISDNSANEEGLSSEEESKENLNINTHSSKKITKKLRHETKESQKEKKSLAQVQIENSNASSSKETSGKSSSSSGDFYKVEKIVAKQKIDGIEYYEVKWLNFPESQNTWEPASHLESCKKAIQSFEKSQTQIHPTAKRSTSTRSHSQRKSNEEENKQTNYKVIQSSSSNMAKSSQIKKKDKKQKESNSGSSKKTILPIETSSNPQDSEENSLSFEPSTHENNNIKEQGGSRKHKSGNKIEMDEGSFKFAIKSAHQNEDQPIRRKRDQFLSGNTMEEKYLRGNTKNGHESNESGSSKRIKSSGMASSSTSRMIDIRKVQKNERSKEETEEGTFEKDEAESIKTHKFIYPMEGDFIDNLLFEIEWKPKENGRKPMKSYQTRKQVKKNCPDLIVDYYENYMDYDLIS